MFLFRYFFFELKEKKICRAFPVAMQMKIPGFTLSMQKGLTTITAIWIRYMNNGLVASHCVLKRTATNWI
jgi:hypothetical protein